MALTDYSKLKIVVNGVTFPEPAYRGYKVIKRKLNAYAERTPKTMRIDQLGDVYEIHITYPVNLDDDTFETMQQALEPFVVTVTYWNPYMDSLHTTKFYWTDQTHTRMWRHINEPFTLELIGTEVI